MEKNHFKIQCLCNSMVWYGMVWYDMVWYGMVFIIKSILNYSQNTFSMLFIINKMPFYIKSIHPKKRVKLSTCSHATSLQVDHRCFMDALFDPIICAS